MWWLFESSFAQFSANWAPGRKSKKKCRVHNGKAINLKPRTDTDRTVSGYEHTYLLTKPGQSPDREARQYLDILSSALLKTVGLFAYQIADYNFRILGDLNEHTILGLRSGAKARIHTGSQLSQTVAIRSISEGTNNNAMKKKTVRRREPKCNGVENKYFFK